MKTKKLIIGLSNMCIIGDLDKGQLVAMKWKLGWVQRKMWEEYVNLPLRSAFLLQLLGTITELCFLLHISFSIYLRVTLNDSSTWVTSIINTKDSNTNNLCTNLYLSALQNTQLYLLSFSSTLKEQGEVQITKIWEQNQMCAPLKANDSLWVFLSFSVKLVSWPLYYRTGVQWVTVYMNSHQWEPLAHISNFLSFS